MSVKLEDFSIDEIVEYLEYNKEYLVYKNRGFMLDDISEDEAKEILSYTNAIFLNDADDFDLIEEVRSRGLVERIIEDQDLGVDFWLYRNKMYDDFLVNLERNFPDLLHGISDMKLVK